MATQPVEGAALRQLINLAKKQSLNFAFCPGAKKDDILLIDRRKAPAALGKDAKKQSTTPKLAYGTLSADGNVVKLVCESELPNLTKQIRKYLKSSSISAKVQVVGADGSVLEEDADPDEEQPQTETAPAPESPAPGADKEAKAQALQRLKEVVMRAAKVGPEAQKLAANAAKAISAQVKSGDLGAADQALTSLTQQIAALADAPPTPEPKPETPAPSLDRVRKDWAAARKTAAQDMRSLIEGMRAAAKDTPELAQAPARIARLAQPLKRLDTKLDTLLDQLGKTENPAERKKLSAAARKQIRDHMAIMNSDFFMTVDQNGFAPTRIRSTVSRALRQVNEALKA
ncbi:hypothetical protein [Ruegeria sp. HKCCD8929]|uniref:hypothetical protein n=1 Tax=Ruegeria sp. HKCCD8929 TaxID=2683006 RepID=UPI0014892FA1|nr:hypothetical protein [Ruegeria sp. HKCCD8929]